MPTEAGMGYQGPPRPDDDPLTRESTRELEDYISRRIKVRLRMDTDQDFAPSANGADFVWVSADYDTAHMWDGSSKIIFPEGSSGDFAIIVHVHSSVSFVVGAGGAGKGEVSLIKTSGVVDTVLDRQALDWSNTSPTGGKCTLVIEESMRAGEQLRVEFTNFSAVNGVAIWGTGNVQTTFSVRRLI